MRKLIVGLIAVGFLAMAGPVAAQTADPLGLIASGAVIPYVGTTNLGSGIAVVNSLTGAITSTFQNAGSLAILEVASPVGSNAPASENIFGARPFHMFFFDQSCARVGPSVGNPLTVNDADLVNLNLIANLPNAGLIAAAAVGQTGGVNDVLLPMTNPIHARVYWINALDGILSRVLEPISIHNPETLSPKANGETWNPLRTGATFVAPVEGSGVSTTLYFVCPTRNIIPGVFPEAKNPTFIALTTATINGGTTTIAVGANQAVQFEPNGVAWVNGTDSFTYTGTTSASFTGVAGVGSVYPVGTVISPVAFVAPGDGFPELRPLPVPGIGSTPLFFRVHDDEEHFRRNIDVFCRCWGAHPLKDIDPIFANLTLAPNGTYTEIDGETVCANPDSGPNGGQGPASSCSFTGYRSIRWGAGIVGNDVFGRLSNGNVTNIQGNFPVPNNATVNVNAGPR